MLGKSDTDQRSLNSVAPPLGVACLFSQVDLSFSITPLRLILQRTEYFLVSTFVSLPVLSLVG